MSKMKKAEREGGIKRLRASRNQAYGRRDEASGDRH